MIRLGRVNEPNVMFTFHPRRDRCSIICSFRGAVSHLVTQIKVSWAGFKQITFRKMKLYSRFFFFFSWKRGKGERELISLFSHNETLVETWDDEQA